MAENFDSVLSTGVRPKIRKFLHGESILLRNFALVVRSFSPRFFTRFGHLHPKIPIRYFRMGCDQLVLLTVVRPKAVFSTFDSGVFPYLGTLTSDATNVGLRGGGEIKIKILEREFNEHKKYKFWKVAAQFF